MIFIYKLQYNKAMNSLKELNILILVFCTIIISQCFYHYLHGIVPLACTGTTLHHFLGLLGFCLPLDL